MAGEIDIYARFLARETGRAAPIASTLQVAVRDDALVLAPVAMAGEDTTIHAVAVGRLGEAPRVLAVPDPREREVQLWLFRTLGELVEAYMQEQLAAGTYPQIWVSSSAAAALLDQISDRYRFTKLDAGVARFATLLAYFTERRPVAGQQALHTATGALCRHLATGQAEGDDEHLGALLTWIERPEGLDVLEAVEQAELAPMGDRTDPAFDRETLVPLVQAYNKDRRAGAPRPVLARHARTIRAALDPVVRAISDATQRAVAILRALPLEPLEDLEVLEANEAWLFARFLRSRAAGYPAPRRDSARAAVHGLVGRESAEQNHDAALIYGDRLARARAVLGGAVVTGVVEEVRSEKVAPRRKIHRVTVRSRQGALRARVRDALCWLDDPRLIFVIESVTRDADGSSLVELRVTDGMRSPGLPAEGEELELGGGGPRWSFVRLEHKKIKRRLTEPPWTHGKSTPELVGDQCQTAPSGLVDLVERLRQ